MDNSLDKSSGAGYITIMGKTKREDSERVKRYKKLRAQITKLIRAQRLSEEQNRQRDRSTKMSQNRDEIANHTRDMAKTTLGDWDLGEQ